MKRNGVRVCTLTTVGWSIFEILLMLEMDRLATYLNWQLDYPGLYPTEMADNGLCYTGEGDKVKCYKCGATIGNWQVGDSVRDKHRQVSPGCELVQQSTKLPEPISHLFARNADSNSGNLNVPDGGNGDETDASQSIISLDNLGEPSQITASNSNRNTPAAATTFSNSVVSTDRVDPTNMKQEAARLATFSNWLKSDIVTPESLAREGFYYRGLGDNTTCAFCSGVLRAWESGDVPSHEHKRNFPKCPFVCGKNVGNVPIATNAQRLANEPQSSSTNPIPRPGQHAVDPREIKARLDTPQVQMFLNQGYSLDTIRSALEDRLRTLGSDFPSAVEFLVALNAKRYEQSLLNAHHSLAPGASNSSVFASNSASASLGAGVVSNAAVGENIVISRNVGSSSTSTAALRSNSPALVPTTIPPPAKPTSSITTSGATTAQQLSALPNALSSMQLSTGRESPAEGKAKKKKKKKNKNGNSASTTTAVGTTTTAAGATTAVAGSTTTVTNVISAAASPTVEAPALTGTGDKEKVADVVKQQQSKAVAQGSSISKYEDPRLCSICQVEDVNIAFVPCGHACTCRKCAGKVTLCPMCRTLIKERIRIYLS